MDDSLAKLSLALCSVEDAFAHTGTYLIRMPAGTVMPATELFHFSGLPLGARPIQMYPPKSRVLVLYTPSLDHAIILGSVPKGLVDPRLVLPDSLVLRSRAGQFEDPMHYSTFSAARSVLGNHSMGRPADALPGDWGAINELGLAIWLGRTMAALRASDLAKVEAFWGDDLLRLVGYNMELFTAGVHEYRYNDEGEYNEVWRATPYPWEGMGLAAPGLAAQDVGGVLKPGSETARFEPNQADQLILARHHRFRGYLGDLERELISAPPAGLTQETYSNPTNHVGLFESVKHINGAYAVRSAKEITLEKYLLIPVPKELIAPEDPLGDGRASNYAAADILGPGTPYQMPEFVWGSEEPQVRAAQLFDYHAWFFSRYTTGGLAAHTKDWHFPDEAGLTALGETAVYDGNLKFGHQFLAAAPSFGQLVIDARPGHSCRYYRSRSCFKLLDDGSVLIEDGYGSQIHMTGGSVFVSCPGDIWQKPGRSAVTWAPFDVIHRAGNSFDASAALGDLRLKAERNLHVLAGNSGVGGLLLESRASGSQTAADFDQSGQRVVGHGITLKAAQSTIHAFGQNIHIGRNQNAAGRFVLDAGRLGTLFLRGQTIQSRVTSLYSVLIASDTAPGRQALGITQQGAVISAPLQIGGTVIIAPASQGAQANLVVGGNLVCHRQGVFGGNVLSNEGFAGRGGPFVAELDRDVDISPAPEDLAEDITNQVTQIDDLTQTQNDLAVSSQDTSPGNDVFQRRVGFSFRDTVLDLKLSSDSFVIFESRWQQMYRKAGGALTIWNEPVVKSPAGSDTRPHPGQQGWETFNSYRTVQDTQNFDGQRAKARSAMTQQGLAPQTATLKEGYAVNVQQ